MTTAATTDRLLGYVFENAIRHDAGSVIEAIDHYGRTAGGMIHLGGQKGDIFDRIVRDSGARRVLELGTNYGYSALRLASNLAEDAQIFTVEIDRALAETAEAVIAYAGLQHRIEVICGKANEVIRNRFSDPFDLVFIDHLPQNYLVDLRVLEELDLLLAGATVVSDNVVIFRDELQLYLRHLRDGGGYASSLHQPSLSSDGIELSIRRNVAA